jgi:hypothetical protein
MDFTKLNFGFFVELQLVRPRFTVSSDPLDEALEEARFPEM